jgi:phosphatidylserine/phosphatidylglycerophosphate/cardiolipin synthase-like enzyme
MHVIPEDDLAKVLRSAVDKAKSRLWIASPYIGGWPGNVRRILGTTWQSSVGDVRLLTDIGADGWRLSTLQQLGRRGVVKSLPGLHAKVYVVDGTVFVGSANLTGTAFSRRHEALVRLTGAAAEEAAAQFDRWWLKGTAVDVDTLTDPLPKPGAADPDEAGAGKTLPLLRALPADVADEAVPGAAYGDYGNFLLCYRELVRLYEASQRPRVWKHMPLNLEVDAFLDFLFHRKPSMSQPFLEETPRVLSDARRKSEMRKWVPLFAERARRGDWSDAERLSSMKTVQRVLRKSQKAGVTRENFAELLGSLNSMNSYQINLSKAISPDNNSLKSIRAAVTLLGDKAKPVQFRLAQADRMLFGVSKSALQEIVGFYEPDLYPLRNQNTNAGLRFFGYDVRVN